ncbi:MAG: TetR/AcrR family transcriptional regulator [Planctomycetota bacterium]|nr:MAG: TetR/AcrR family transcriptional regulator [Planctomycetota bacterium]
MPPTKTPDEPLLDALADVFRRHGYEGASLSAISRATGLQRASLYHRFPGGKAEMADAALGRVDQRFEREVLAPLASSLAPRARVEQTAQRLREFYAGGEKSCALDTLSLGDLAGPLREHMERSLGAWIGAFAAVAQDAGLSEAEARRRALNAVVRIQGALVVARITGDSAPFREALDELPATLLGGASADD